nr:transposase [Thioalkalivibrio sp. AKL6]
MARVGVPHVPHHVVQRGHNRQVVFAGPEDYERYLEDLRELSSALEIRVYAYCLMTNHVHLSKTGTDLFSAARMRRSGRVTREGRHAKDGASGVAAYAAPCGAAGT